MAENKDGQEKTEKATGKRLEDSRQEGKVAKSMEINSLLVFSVGILAVYFSKGHIGDKFLQLTNMMWGSLGSMELNLHILKMLAAKGFLFFLVTLAPLFIGILLAGIGATYGQIGFKLSSKALLPKFEKLDPIKGVKNLLFSSRSYVELIKSMLKLFIIGLFIYIVLKDTILASVQLVKFSVFEIISFMIDSLISFLWKVALVYAVLAVIDLVYQKYKFNKDMMMTKQEVKDESKDTEGNPEIKSQIKNKQFEMAKSRMMKDVPKADVVITNPTHFAVALQYQVGGSSAPKVVAKGADFIAQKIKEIARANDVPLHEDVFLARALYKACDVGDEIPENLYKAVAQILAHIFRLKNEKKQVLFNLR